jgi:hypothetical protein
MQGRVGILSSGPRTRACGGAETVVLAGHHLSSVVSVRVGGYPPLAAGGGVHSFTSTNERTDPFLRNIEIFTCSRQLLATNSWRRWL